MMMTDINDNDNEGPAAISHGFNWYVDEQKSLLDVGGAVPTKNWFIKDICW